MRVLTGILIAVFWLGMMASLIWHHLLPARATGGEHLNVEQVTNDWQDVEEWMLISIGGKPSGVACSSVRKSEQGGYKAVSRARLSLQGSFNRPLSFTSVAQLTDDFHLNTFWISVTASPLALDVRALVWEDRLLVSFASTPGSSKKGYYPLKEPIVLMDSIRPITAQKFDLKPGSVYKVPGFDAWSGLAGEAVLRVIGTETIVLGGQTYQATKLETTLAGQHAAAWIGPDQSVLRYQLMKDVTFDKISRVEGLKQEKSFADEPGLPVFNVEEFSQNKEVMDLSKQSPLGMLSQVFFGAVKP